MKPPQEISVCAVTNDPNLNDYRIENGARTLAGAGYAVSVIMAYTSFSLEETKPYTLVISRPTSDIPLTVLLRASRKRDPLGHLIGYVMAMPRCPDASSESAAEIQGEAVGPGQQKVPIHRRALGAILNSICQNPLIYSLLARLRFYGTEALVYREIVDADPDVIHVHDLPLLRVGRLASQRIGAKLIYDAHEIHSLQGSLSVSEVRHWSDKERQNVPAADAVITVNSFLARKLEEMYALRPVHVIHNAPEYSSQLNVREESRRELTRGLAGEKTCVLLYVGSLSEGRGLTKLLEALSALPANFLLAVLGDGDLAPKLREQATRTGVLDRIIFHGMVSRERVGLLAVGADIALVTQEPTGWNEIHCSPNRLGDYVMAGLPICASDLPFLHAFVEKYGCGRVFDMGSATDLHEVLARMWRDQEEFSRMREACLTAAQDFNWETEGRKLVDIYNDLVHTSGVPV